MLRIALFISSVYDVDGQASFSVLIGGGEIVSVRITSVVCSCILASMRARYRYMFQGGVGVTSSVVYNRNSVFGCGGLCCIEHSSVSVEYYCIITCLPLVIVHYLGEILVSSLNDLCVHCMGFLVKVREPAWLDESLHGPLLTVVL